MPVCSLVAKVWGKLVAGVAGGYAVGLLVGRSYATDSATRRAGLVSTWCVTFCTASRVVRMLVPCHVVVCALPYCLRLCTAPFETSQRSRGL